MKKILIVLLGLMFYLESYSGGISSGNDTQGLLTSESIDGETEDIVIGYYKRNLKNSEGILIKLIQSESDAIKSIKAKKLNSTIILNYPSSIGRIENLKYFINNREIKVGDIINFAGSSTEINIEVLGNYLGTSQAQVPINNDRIMKTENLTGVEFEYSTNSGEIGRIIRISQAKFTTRILGNLRLYSYGDINFGRIIAGESGEKSARIGTYIYPQSLNYEVPNTVDLKNERGEILTVNFSHNLENGENPGIRYVNLTGRINVPLTASSGKYKGSLRVKFIFE